MSIEQGNGAGPEGSDEQIKKHRSFFDRILNRNNDISVEEEETQEEDSTETEDAEESEAFIKAQEFVDNMEQMTAQEWREKKIDEKYTGHLAWLKAFAAGERNFSIDEDGNIKRNAFNELVQKGLVTIFNRRTAIAASTMAIAAILTGGVSLAATGALFGSMAGRGVVEALHSLNGKEKGLREEIAKEEFKQFQRLQEKAYEANDLDIDEEERNTRIADLINDYYTLSEDVENLRKEVITQQQIWNKKRRIGEFIGGIVGLGAGIWAGFQGLAEKAMTMDIDGNGVIHAVEKVNGSWHYVYNTQAEAINALKQGATVVPNATGIATHALGETSNVVISHVASNLAGEAAQVGAVILGLGAGQIWEHSDDKNAVDNYLADRTQREEQNNQDRADYGGFGATEAITSETVDWQVAFQEAGKPMPAVGSIWQVEGAPNYLKINNIDPETGNATADIVDDDYKLVQANISFALNDLLTHGQLSAGIEPFVTQPKAPEPDDVIPEPETPEKKTKKLSLIEQILGFADRTDLESKTEFEESIRKVMEILKKEEAVIELKRGIPTIIIPDLHARREMLKKVLNRTVNGKKVSALLKQGKINIVCLGDGMHSEIEENWVQADGTKVTSPEQMNKEMVDSLNLMQIVMELKSNFPENFQYLRGNHDEIKGNFYKYANESVDVRNWVVDNYGADFLAEYAAFEEALPLMAVGDGFIASHTASGEAYTRDQINSRDKDVAFKLRWTDNTKGQTTEEAVNGTLANLGTPNGVYIIGHRAVSDAEGLSREQFNGKLIQVNNAEKMIIGVVEPGAKPVFEELK